MTKYDNLGYAKAHFGEMGKRVTGFSKIRSFGDKNNAITYDGDKVERQELLYVEGYGLTPCTPYELHFIYIDPRSLDTPRRIKGRWGIMCTCGSMAGVISYNELKTLMTVNGQRGYILGCLVHTQGKHATGIGKHADGSSE